MKTKLLVLALAMCMIATPAKADLFNFTVHTLDMTYAGGNFDGSLNADGGIFFTRDRPTTGTILLNHDPGDFAISMAITNIVNTPGSQSADGAGDFTLTDINGDTITGDVLGEWALTGGIPTFAGELSEVYWNNENDDNTFDGDYGWPDVINDPDSVSMIFTGYPHPWTGTLIELTAEGATWFGFGAWLDGNQDPLLVTGGSVDARVVPLPAAVLLGVLGLGVVGLKLRKYA